MLKIRLNSVNKTGLALFIFFFTAAALSAVNYPLIIKLENNDPLFRQLNTEIEAFYFNLAKNPEFSEINLYSYIIKEKDSIFSIASRLNLTYDTIASLNRIPDPSSLKPGTELVLPSGQGLFLPENGKYEFEKYMLSWRDKAGKKMLIRLAQGEKTETFYFLPGERFLAAERAFFLGILFRFPLPEGYISSEFGYRKDPFSGKNSFHRGIDIAAPENTDVYAARAGTVSFVGKNPVYGNYIIITHENNYETIYGHLNKIFVELNQKVNSAIIIGKVGATGKTTGYHLHFEIKYKGENRDPLMLLPKSK
jgi:murein DD-endopeptidase MepM/ murein hydrolase activator NlpD